MATDEEKFRYQCAICRYFNFVGDCLCSGGRDPNNLSMEIPQEIKDGTITCNFIQDKNGANQIEVSSTIEVDIETDDMTTWAIIDDSGTSLLMPSCRLGTATGSIVTVVSTSSPIVEMVVCECSTQSDIPIVEIVEDMES